jgi:hypothetical protein
VTLDCNASAETEVGDAVLEGAHDLAEGVIVSTTENSPQLKESESRKIEVS